MAFALPHWFSYEDKRKVIPWNILVLIVSTSFKHAEI